MRPLDDGFTTRVLQTSLALGAIALLPLLAQPLPHPYSFLAGLGSAALIWRGAEAIGRALTPRKWRAREVAALVVIYLGKYALIGGIIWGLLKCGLLAPTTFAAGALLPTLVAFLKAIAWIRLPAGADPIPYYARTGKVVEVD